MVGGPLSRGVHGPGPLPNKLTATVVHDVVAGQVYVRASIWVVPNHPERLLGRRQCFLHLSSVFLTYPNALAAKISVFFLSPYLFFLPCSQTYRVYAATATISMFSSSRLDLCTVILSNTASLRVPRFGAKHCREYCTSKIQAP